MARNPRKQQRRVIVYVVSLWYQLLLQCMSLLTNGNRRKSLTDSDERVPRPLPYGREVYRGGFLLHATRTTYVNCINMLRVKYRVFWKLCDLLRDAGGLKRTKNMEVDEMVAMFLVTVGHNLKNRACQFLFRRSGETICRTIKAVLLAVLNLHNVLLANPLPIAGNSNDPRWKYFKGCLGAIDGTLISVRTSVASQQRYRTRKGNTTINILAAVTPKTEFIYCLAGWEGSAHDSRVLRNALSKPGGFRVPEALYYLSFYYTRTYYLCDAGYTNAKGFLAPYRGQRYHLSEWGSNRPHSAEEYFNMKHSSARNVIERSFGVLKMRWALLRDTSWYSPKMVGMFFTACCLLHNFIIRHGPDVFDRAYCPSSTVEPPIVEEIDEAPAFILPSPEWTQFRDDLAQYMWANRHR